MMVAVVWIACAGVIAGETSDSRAIDQLVFQGVKSFNADDIRKALTCDVDVTRAERSPADRAGLLRAIERTVELGFRHSGFGSPKVAASYDESTDRITAVIVEGPRHLCGSVRITGDKGAPTQALIESLTTSVGKKDALWQQGEPAPLDDETTKQMRQRVAEALANEGFFSPTFDLEIEAPREQEQATLVVDIKDAGPRAQIGEINVIGTERDDQATVVRHLGLGSGQPLDSRLPDRIHRQLLESGRYLTSDVEIVRSTPQSEAGRQSLDLTIRVREYEAAPPLSEPLSTEEQAVLRLADWTRRWSAGGLNEDLVITMACGPEGAAAWLETLGFSAPQAEKASVAQLSLRVVLSPRDGTALTLRASGAEDRTIEEWVLASYRDRLLLGSLVRSAKLEVPDRGYHQLTVSVATESADSHDEDEPPFKFCVGAHYKTIDPKNANLFKVDVKLLPSSLLALVRNPECTSKFQDGQLIIKSPDRKVQIDAASGRPIMIGLANGDSWITITATGDALDFERRAIDEQLKDARTYDAASPFRSAVCLLLDERVAALERQVVAEADPSLGRRIAAWKALRKQCESALQHTSADRKSKNAITSFSLPEHDDVSFYRDLWGANPEARRYAIGWVLGNYRRIVPKDGWLWPLGRDVLLLHVDELPDGGYQALARSADVGPVGQYLLIWLGAENAARLGYQRITLDDFRRDYRPLLAGDSELSKLMLSLAEAARSLEEQELRALVGFVENEASRQALAEGLAVLRNDPQRPIADSAADALDRLWQDWLGPNLRTTFVLQLLAEERARTAAVPQSVKSGQAVSPLQQPLGRLEEIEKELRDAATKERPKD
jgi:hypothetical protein